MSIWGLSIICSGVIFRADNRCSPKRFNKMKAIIRYLKNLNLEYSVLLLWIFSLPVMSNRYLGSGSLFQRAQIFDFVFVFLVSISLIKFLNGCIKFTVTRLWLVLVMLIVSFLISSLNSEVPLIGFSESLVILYLITIYLFVANVIRDRKILSLCLKGWVFTSLIIALLGISGMILAFFGFNNYFVRFYFDFLNKAFRLISTMSLPNMAYSYLHVSFFLTLGLLINETHKKRRAFYLFAIIVLLIALFFTFSRGWVSLLFGSGIFLYFFSKEGKLKFKGIAKVLFLLAFIVFVFVQLFITYTTDLNFSLKYGYDDTYKVDYSNEARNKLFKQDYFFDQGQPYRRLDLGIIFLPGEYGYKKMAAVKLWQEHPLFGIGPGMFNVFSVRLAESKALYFPKNIAPCDPHSTYFGSLAEGGLFGLGVLFILFFYFLKILAKAFKRMKEQYFRNLILCCISAFSGLLVFGLYGVIHSDNQDL